MTAIVKTIRSNYERICQNVVAACERRGRDPDAVKVIAVVKYAELEWVRGLLDLGVTDFGESRPQQLIDRAAQFDSAIRWHQIGHLQRNKIRKLLPLVSLIHSVDSLKLLQAVDRVAADLRLNVPVLLQMNLSGEESKGGFRAQELTDVLEAMPSYRHVNVQGLMTMAPGSRDPDEARKTFADLRRLRDDIVPQYHEQFPLPELSMGMSGDFEIAIEEGATMVRIGSGLFAGLNPVS